MSEPITFTITEGDYISLLSLNFWQSVRQLVALWVVVFGLICTFFILSGEPGNAGATAIVAALIFPLLVLVTRYFVVPRQARRAHREYALLREEVTMSFDQAAFVMRQKSGWTRICWGDLVRWAECDEILALYPSSYLAYIVPKRALEDGQIAAIRQNLVEGGLPKKGRSRR